MSEQRVKQISPVDHVRGAPIAEGSEVFTVVVEIAPGSPGTPPHRHPGPVFGYMLEGEMLYELEGDVPRVVKAGEGFWEPGGDLVHWQAANLLQHRSSRFVVMMMCPSGADLLTFLTPQEMKDRDRLRHPMATAWR